MRRGRGKGSGLEAPVPGALRILFLPDLPLVEFTLQASRQQASASGTLLPELNLYQIT